MRSMHVRAVLHHVLVNLATKQCIPPELIALAEPNRFRQESITGGIITILLVGPNAVLVMRGAVHLGQDV